MADSIKEAALKDLESAVKNVKIANGYTNDIEDNAVLRNATMPNNFNILPAAFIYEGKPEKVGYECGTNYKIIWDLPVMIEVWGSDVDDLTGLLDSLETDITKAVMVDEERGGNAMFTEPSGTERVISPGDEMGVMVMGFNIRYECRENDPTLN